MFDEIFINLPKTPIGWVLLVGVAILTLGQIFNYYRSKNAEESKKLIDTLFKRVDSLQKQHDESTATQNKLIAENDILKALVLQTNPEDKRLREAAIEGLRQINEIYQHLMSDIQIKAELKEAKATT